ncbi:MAG: GNAT family N-acetyltransferase [Bacteroides sp.]|nr:GNAT family N-acetyltransferase [Bacteroides sp.]
MIEIRKTKPAELDCLMDIFEQAKRIMRKDDNMKQWTGGYPTDKIIRKDIADGNSYVCLNENREIIGTFAFIRGNDPTYARIYEGEWLEDTLPYGVIHRLASTEDSKGVAAACLQWRYEQIQNLRADTHRDNRILQHILKKHGFRYCGIIYLLNGDERLAFQKIEQS